MKSMKTALTALALSTSLAFTAAPPRDAHAIVGAVTALAGGAGVPLLVAGAVATAAGIAGVTDCESCGLGVMITSFSMAFFGPILLDDGTVGDLEFVAVDQARAAQAGLTENERLAFNSELDEINAIKETITSDLKRDEKPTAEKAHALWSEYGQSLSQDAFLGLGKISAAIRLQMDAR